MSNYVKATDFSVKDGLLPGNPAKIVKGTEIDDEFDAISASIQTKADLASPTFTGSPAAPTASPGTSTTQLATTAFVAAAAAAVLSSVYPVGSIYTNAVNSTNPATLLGFGTWTAFGAGRVMVGFNASDPLFDSAEETGGSKDAIAVSHTHTASTNSTGAHQHYVAGGTYSSTNAGFLDSTSPNNNTLKAGDNLGGNANQYWLTSTTSTADKGLTNSAGAHSHTVTVDSTGSSGTNANLQPYITVYMWKRTA
jgi:hypothetical protein